MRYGIYYKGVLAASHLTFLGAKTHVQKLIKFKGFEAIKIEIRRVTQ